MDVFWKTIWQLLRGNLGEIGDDVAALSPRLRARIVGVTKEQS
jgi:hypothetical protein